MRFTCCWTDHSKGCPAKELREIFERTEHSQANLEMWFRLSHGVKVRLGYEEQLSEAEIKRYCKTLWKWEQEDERQGLAFEAARELPYCDDCPTQPKSDDKLAQRWPFWSPNVCRKEVAHPCPRVAEYDRVIHKDNP